jgi:hypothetical protein
MKPYPGARLMIAGIYNITCEQGSSFLRVLEIEQPDLATDPTGNTYEPFDLSGYTARMQVRRTVESSSTLVELTTQNLGLEINPNGENPNMIVMRMASEVTASIETSGVYDLEIISNNGFVSKVIRGLFNLLHEVTK